MAYVGQIIDIFVSSPGDVSEYRNSIVSIVQAWNQRNGKSRRLFFNCLRWEDLVAPDIGESGQDVINHQVGNDYDIFLGVMWARFGSPTLSAESGTEEEFDRAVTRHQAGEPIRVSFLFCTADVPIARLDGVQFTKVQEFKKKAQDGGCLTRDFLDEASLINAINMILDRFANTWQSEPIPEMSQTIDVGRPDTETVTVESDESHEDLGILDVLEDFTNHNSEFVASLNDWSERLNSVQRETTIATAKLSDISKFGSPEPHQVREILNDLTSEMERFGNWCDDELIVLEKVMEQLSRDSLLLLDLSRDLQEPTEDIISARNTMASLYASIAGANEGILSFADTVESSPKLDKKLNRANRKVVAVHRRLAEKNRLFQENVSLCISDLNERLGEDGEGPQSL